MLIIAVQSSKPLRIRVRIKTNKNQTGLTKFSVFRSIETKILYWILFFTISQPKCEVVEAKTLRSLPRRVQKELKFVQSKCNLNKYSIYC